jgi:ADP-heptose:LPS heptosyltransferase
MQLKSIEHFWRRLWIRLLTRALARRRPAADGMAIRSVLFLRPDRIGDMIVSMGVLRAIADATDGITLDVLASPANAPVAAGERFIRQVHRVDRRRPWRWPAVVVRLRARRYDAVVDCMPTAPSVTTLLLMVAAGARERIGVAGRGNDDAFTITVPPRAGARHIVDHLSALAQPFGVELGSANVAPSLTISRAERTRALATWNTLTHGVGAARRLLVNVSAGTKARHWPDERFVEMLRLVRRTHPEAQPLLIGGPEDQERVRTMSRVAGVPAAATPALRDALALVATADLILSADTGLAHAAAAFRRPAVVMHRRGSAVLWGLYGAPGSVLESADETLASLDVAPVWRALETLLAPESSAPLADTTRPQRQSRVSSRYTTGAHPGS